MSACKTLKCNKNKPKNFKQPELLNDFAENFYSQSIFFIEFYIPQFCHNKIT